MAPAVRLCSLRRRTSRTTAAGFAASRSARPALADEAWAAFAFLERGGVGAWRFT
jgi:hypothetical protein